jgi:hypothetical protein
MYFIKLRGFVLFAYSFLDFRLLPFDCMEQKMPIMAIAKGDGHDGH